MCTAGRVNNATAALGIFIRIRAAPGGGYVCIAPCLRLNYTRNYTMSSGSNSDESDEAPEDDDEIVLYEESSSDGEADASTLDTREVYRLQSQWKQKARESKPAPDGASPADAEEDKRQEVTVALLIVS